MPIKNDSRRDFIKTTVAGSIGMAINVPALSYGKILGSNDRVHVGVVGFSDRARAALIPTLQEHAVELNFDIVGVSDIWNRRRDEGAAFISQLTGKPTAKARNNDELYDMKDVDAVIIATADHQHAQHGIEAVRAGRDAYIEKPLANVMSDARALLKAVEETQRIVQVGTERRSGQNYVRAREFIRSGKFSDINMVEMAWNVNLPGRWRRPQLVKELRAEDTDWNRFVMNRPKEDWNPRKYIEFRLFWPYSSGIPCQWMVHQIDILQWFTGFDRPRSVVASGGVYQWKDGRKNYDTITVIFDYGPLGDPSKGFQAVFSSRMGNSAGDPKGAGRETYYSNAGTLDLYHNTISPAGGLRNADAAVMGLKANLLPEISLAEPSEAGASAGAMPISTSADNLATSAHMRNWMECVRTRKAPRADIYAGYSHSVALCMTIAALQSGKRVTFDDARQEVIIS